MRVARFHNRVDACGLSIYYASVALYTLMYLFLTTNAKHAVPRISTVGITCNLLCLSPSDIR